MKRLKQYIMLLIIVGLLVLFFVLKDDFSGVINVLLNSKKSYIIIVLIVFMLGDLFKSVSITNIIKEEKKDYKYKYGFFLLLKTNFFNGVTPFSLGGQPYQLYTLKKKDKIDYITGANIVFKDFYTYQLALVILSFISLLIIYSFDVIIFSPVIKKLIWIGFTVNFVIGLILIYLPYSKSNGKRIINTVISLLNKLNLVKDKEQKIHDINKYVDKFKTQINRITSNKKMIFACVLLNSLKLISIGITTFFCFKSVGSNVPILSSIVISILILTMASFIPIPGASGGMEYGFAALFSYYVIDAKLSAVLLIWRFLTYYLPVIIGGFIVALENRE